MRNLNTSEINVIFGGDAVCANKSDIVFIENDGGIYKGTFHIGAIIGKSLYAGYKSVKITLITLKVGAVNFVNGFYSVLHNTKKPIPVVDPKDRDL